MTLVHKRALVSTEKISHSCVLVLEFKGLWWVSTAVADPCEGQGDRPPPPTPLIFRSYWGPRDRKKLFGDQAPSFSKGLDDCSPPPSPPPPPLPPPRTSSHGLDPGTALCLLNGRQMPFLFSLPSISSMWSHESTRILHCLGARFLLMDCISMRELRDLWTKEMPGVRWRLS